MMHDAGRPTVTIAEARVACGVSRRTIYNWIQRQKVDYVRTAGGSVRIFADSLHRASPRPPFERPA